VLAVDGIPVRWETIKVPNPSGSCPLCRANKEGEASVKKALDRWIQAARMDPRILTDSPKVSENNSDKESGVDFKTQQLNKKKQREESNRKIVQGLKGSSIPNNNKRLKNEPAFPKKPNHLRIV
jgi:hypothetical protein